MQTEILEPEIMPDESPHTQTRELVQHAAASLMPAISVEDAVERYDALKQFVSRVLRPDVDFGLIPGTGTKKTLLKPGAEKLTTFFGLSKRFEILERVEDWTGEAHGGEPFFYYLIRCRLLRGDELIAEADGSCNSWEKKYRYRKGEIVCPHCGTSAVIKGKQEYGGGWLCFKKRGGCGARFDSEQWDESAIRPVPNSEIFDQVNTIQKMAEKRALIAATLIGVNASEFFTQDMEDFTPATPTARTTEDGQDELRAEILSEASTLGYDAGKVKRWVNQKFEVSNGLDDLTRVDLVEVLNIFRRKKAESPVTAKGDGGESSKVASLRDKRAQGVAAMGLVSREGDRFVVSSPLRDQQTVHDVTVDEKNAYRCTCIEFEEESYNDAAFVCEHIIAVRHALRTNNVKSSETVSDSMAREPEPAASEPVFPDDPTAKSRADLITPKQLGMIRALAREAGLDPDDECQSVMRVRTEDLSKRAASSFIDHLKRKGGGA